MIASIVVLIAYGYSRGRRRVGRSRDADGGRCTSRRARPISAVRRSTRSRSWPRCLARGPAVVCCRSRVRPDLRRHARHSLGRARCSPWLPHPAVPDTGGVAARRVGRDRSDAVSDRRVPVFARHVRGPRAELSGDSADGRCADGRAWPSCRSRSCRRRLAACRRLCRARRRRRARVVGQPRRLAPAATFRVAPPSWPVVAIYYAALVAAWCLRRRSVGDAVESRARVPSRVQRGRGRFGALDACRTVDGSPSPRRRPSSRLISRRRAGRLRVRAVSAAARRCLSMPAG